MCLGSCLLLKNDKIINWLSRWHIPDTRLLPTPGLDLYETIILHAQYPTRLSQLYQNFGNIRLLTNMDGRSVNYVNTQWQSQRSAIFAKVVIVRAEGASMGDSDSTLYTNSKPPFTSAYVYRITVVLQH